MAKVQGTFYTAERLRRGTSPISPPYLGEDGQPYPVNPPGSGVSTYLTLADTKDGSYVGKNGFVSVVTNEDGLTLMPIQNSEKAGLISGGVVQWTGSGYDFNVSAALARFQSVVLNSNEAVLSLTTPDATNNRIDLFILQILFDGDGIPNGMEADFITGTPAGSPVKPQIDPATQIELTQVTVTAASSTPTLTEEVIYDESIEWTGSSSGTGTVAFNSAANPFQGSLSIEATNIQNGLKIRLTDGSDYDLSGVQTLGMQLDLKAQMFAGQNIGVTFLDSTGAAISTELTLNFDKISTDYQFIGIALSQFSFTSFLARSIEFRYIRTKGATVHTGFFLDIIKLEGGINPPSVGGIPEAPNDGFAYTRKSDAWARLTPYDLAQEGATDGQVLTWVAANSRYEPVTPSGGGITGSGTANEIAYFTGATAIASLPVATYPSLTELSYVKGVTSSIQTQINAAGSKWTVVGSDIYRNSKISVGHTGTPSESIDLGPTGWVKIPSYAFGGGGIILNYYGNSASRSWAIASDGSAYGDFTIKRSATQTGDPKAGTVSFLINNNGDVAIGASSAYSFQSYTYLHIYGKSTTQGGVIALSTSNSSFGWQTYVDSTSVVSRASGNIPWAFIVNGAERFRVFANGNFQIGWSGDLGFKFYVGGTSRFDGNVTIIDAANIITGTTTGTKIGTATNQKIAFWNKTPIIQPTTAITGATLAGGGGTTITDTHTFGGYTLQQLAAALINTGLIA